MANILNGGDRIEIDNYPALVKIPPTQMTVERMAAIEAKIGTIDAFGLSGDRYKKSLEMITNCLLDEDGEHVRSENGGVMTQAQRKKKALDILRYLEAAFQFKGNYDSMLELGLAFYTLDGIEAVTDSPIMHFHTKKQIVGADSGAWLFFCIAGARCTETYKNLDAEQIIHSLKISDIILPPLEPNFGKQTTIR